MVIETYSPERASKDIRMMGVKMWLWGGGSVRIATSILMIAQHTNRLHVVRWGKIKNKKNIINVRRTSAFTVCFCSSLFFFKR